jgi:hypothetical protein
VKEDWADGWLFREIVAARGNNHTLQSISRQAQVFAREKDQLISRTPKWRQYAQVIEPEKP